MSSSILHWLSLSPLGSGSFGHVSLALNLHDSSLFAIKSAPSSACALLSLENELRILQSLHSPFIIRCLGAEFSPALYDSSPSLLRNIFLEYMDGGSLADLLKQSGGKLHDERLVAHYTLAILRGLHYLHQNGIAHCDIKSHNILIGSSGIKIADFGAAKRMGEPVKADKTARGTPLWMAPEVMQGMEQGTASDIWSLGCTVVEMLQGRPPWAHISNLAALFLKVGSSQEDPPLPDSISAEARDFLLRCLHRDPKARPTAAELLQHPFLCKNRIQPAEAKAAAMYVDQPSPRSVMNFVQSDGESDWEDQSLMAPVPVSAGGFPPSPASLDGNPAAIDVHSSAAAAYRAPNVNFGASGKWMTVRHRERICSEANQNPFSQAAGAAGLVHARKGSEVSLESAAFLRSKRLRISRVGQSAGNEVVSHKSTVEEGG